MPYLSFNLPYALGIRIWSITFDQPNRLSDRRSFARACPVSTGLSSCRTEYKSSEETRVSSSLPSPSFEMAPQNFTRYVLAERPKEHVTPTTFKKEVVSLPEPRGSQVLVEVNYLSMEPAMRGWLGQYSEFLSPAGFHLRVTR